MPSGQIIDEVKGRKFISCYHYVGTYREIVIGIFKGHPFTSAITPSLL